MKITKPVSATLMILGALTIAACAETDNTQEQSEPEQASAETITAAPAKPPMQAEESEPELSDKARKLAEDAKSLGSSAWDVTKEEAGVLMEKSKDAIGDAADATGDAVDNVKEKGANMYDAIKEKGAEAYENVKESSADAYDSVKEQGASAYDSIKEKASDALDSAQDGLESETPEPSEASSTMPREI